MLRDARRLGADAALSCDVCIVGAGPAGLVLATELGRAGLSVILVEAGKRTGGGRSQTLYRGTALDPGRHLSPDRDRFRGLGGSSQAWGGRCMPYDPIDFEARPALGTPGWPFGPAELDRWYRAAQVYADCGAYAYTAEAAGLEGDLIGGFSSDTVRSDTLERWSTPTHFGKTLGPALAAMETVTVLTGAVAVGLDRTPGGNAVAGVRIKSFPGLRSARIAARRVVLAGGGLETTRLLLSTAGDGAAAIGDGSGWLGRGYMCHVMGTIARVRLRPGARVIFGFEQDADGVYVRRRLTLTEETLRHAGLPNIYMLFDRPLMGNAEHGNAVLSLAYLVKRLLQRQSRDGTGGGDSAVIAHLKNLLTGAPQALSVLPKFGRDRFLQGRRLPSLLQAGADQTYYLTFHAEQSPLRGSRLSLSETRDATGLPRLDIAPQQAEWDVQGIVEAHALLGRELARAGVADLEFLGEDPQALVRQSAFTLGHHIGTTRMSAAPSDGVVDPDLRVHGMENLFVASASSLPTSSQAHPTLTILALSLRLAARLKQTA